MRKSKQPEIFSLFILSICYGITMAADSPCGDWEPYKDEKCFKIIDETTRTYDDAAKTCSQQENSANLVIIRSKDEQDFLSHFLFKTHSVVDNVWIGVKYINNKFKWVDESDISFTNWVGGSPQNQTGYDCVQMIPDASSMGKWINEPCGRKNSVVCQKVQNWSISRLQEKLLDARKQLSDSLEEVRNQLQNSNKERKQLKDSLENVMNELNNHQTTINYLQQNPVPLGFIYVQLGNQTEPKTIWPRVEWLDISEEYAGLFFRTIGGNSADFQKTQEQNFPALSVARSCCEEKDYLTSVPNLVVPKNGDSSQYIVLGSDRGSFHMFTSFKYTSDEIRPRNQAVRIWKRIK